MSEDPLGLGPDRNPTRYVGNAPTMYADPTGTTSQVGQEAQDALEAIAGDDSEARSEARRIAQAIGATFRNNMEIGIEKGPT
jgi:hypothetical protein